LDFDNLDWGNNHLFQPKRVELTLYNGIPHLLTPVITEAKKAILTLKWATKEMDRRYDVLQENKVRDISSYHKNILQPELERYERRRSDGKATEDESRELPELMPYIVVIVDELADLMSAYPRELESAIVRLAQMSRAVGIHLIISTQRPSVNVITGLINQQGFCWVSTLLKELIDTSIMEKQANSITWDVQNQGEVHVFVLTNNPPAWVVLSVRLPFQQPDSWCEWMFQKSIQHDRQSLRGSRDSSCKHLPYRFESHEKGYCACTGTSAWHKQVPMVQ
jgi:hypothetical protein